MSSVTNSGTVSGGSGGGGGGRGGGGGGGVVDITDSNLTFTNTGTIQGGSGGAANTGSFSAGAGGAGGGTGGGVGDAGGSGGGGGGGAINIDASSSNVTIVNSGSVSGGGGGGPTGSAGAGGAGVAGSGITVINSGSITGGLSGDGTTRANAITFTGGTNVLELQSGSSITGTVAASTGDTLRLGGSANTSFDVSQIGGQYSGFGIFEKAGASTWTLSGTNNSSMAWAIKGGSLVVNGSMTGTSLTVNSGGVLGGSGTVGDVTVNADGKVQPGDSFVTLNVVGTFTQNSGSTYAPSVNAAGQSDKINVTGNAVINAGATVAVQAASGSYARNTTYTILTASTGVTGTYSSVTSNFAFLSPSLSYDHDNVYLTLLQGSNAFAGGARSGNQYAVGTVLDRANSGASGDFATVLNALSALDTTQGPRAIDAISGQPAANLGTANMQAAGAFMSAAGAQMGSLHGGLGGGTHVAMAAPASGQTCSFACEIPQPARYGAWLSGVAGLGSVLGNGNAGALTYNFGGTAVGMDHAFAPDFRAGVSAGYVTGTQWTDGFNGRGITDAFSGSLYASYTPGRLYIDGLVGYAYAINRLTRTISIPGLQPRTASGTTGANQVMGLIETGYRLDLPLPHSVPATAAITPFFRLAGSTTSQNGFTESGAQSLDLTVQQQTTNSLRTTIGADLSAEIHKVDVDIRLGWQHENADTARPMTASFGGAPGQAFTVYGATPQRDSAVLGLAASTQVAEATELYARYDGEVGGGSDDHAFTAGLKMTW
jgi:uncharacterized protein with beta-barrel porin domain